MVKLLKVSKTLILESISTRQIGVNPVDDVRLVPELGTEGDGRVGEHLGLVLLQRDRGVAGQVLGHWKRRNWRNDS